MREAELQVEPRPPVACAAITDAHCSSSFFEKPCETPFQHVREVRTQRAGVHQRFLVALGDFDAHFLPFLHQAQARTQRQLQRALGALDGDGRSRRTVVVTPCGQRNRPF